MLPLLRDASDRKLRLLACACLRWSWRDTNAPYIDELAVSLRLAEAWADEGACPKPTREDIRVCEGKANLMNKYVLGKTGWKAAAGTVKEASLKGYFPSSEARAHQASLLRDIFNPFHPVVLDSSWQTPTVVSLAKAAYDERPTFSGELDTGHLAILADALEEVGCDNAELLGHLRGPGPHVRGCFALDALLSKS